MRSTSTLSSWLRHCLTLLLVVSFVAIPADADAKRRKKKKKKKKKAVPAKVAPVAAEGELVIFSTTNGAIVEIDGKKVGTLPFKDPMKIAVGTHSIRVYLRGWTDFSDTFEIKAGEETELEIDLLPSAGIMKITTNKPGATVKVNNKVVGVTPFDGDVPVGKVDILVTLPGHKDWTKKMDIAPGKTYDETITLEALPNVGSGPEFYETWWFWTIIGVAVVGGATAGAVVATQDGGTQAPVADFKITIP